MLAPLEEAGNEALSPHTDALCPSGSFAMLATLVMNFP